MRELLQTLKAEWTTPNAFPWDQLTEILCGLDDRLTALETARAPTKDEQIATLTEELAGRPAAAPKTPKTAAVPGKPGQAIQA